VAEKTATAREKRIRRWLARKPEPKVCLISDAEDKQRKIKITAGRYRWDDAVRACEGAVRMTAIDADGAELRTLDIEAADDSEQPERDERDDQEEDRTHDIDVFRSLLAKEIPALVDRIAMRLEAASKTAYEAGARSSKDAFESLVGVVKAQGAVASGAVKDNALLVRQLREALLSQPVTEAPSDGLEGIMQMLLGQAGGGVPGLPAPNGGITIPAELVSQLLHRFMPQGAPAAPDPDTSNGVS